MNLSTLLRLKRAAKSGDSVKPVQSAPATIAAPVSAALVANTVDQTPRHKQETADCPKHFCIYALRFGCPLCAQDDYHNTFGTLNDGPYIARQMEEDRENGQGDALCPS